MYQCVDEIEVPAKLSNVLCISEGMHTCGQEAKQVGIWCIIGRPVEEHSIYQLKRSANKVN